MTTPPTVGVLTAPTTTTPPSSSFTMDRCSNLVIALIRQRESSSSSPQMTTTSVATAAAISSTSTSSHNHHHHHNIIHPNYPLEFSTKIKEFDSAIAKSVGGLYSVDSRCGEITSSSQSPMVVSKDLAKVIIETQLSLQRVLLAGGGASERKEEIMNAAPMPQIYEHPQPTLYTTPSFSTDGISSSSLFYNVLSAINTSSPKDGGGGGSTTSRGADVLKAMSRIAVSASARGGFTHSYVRTSKGEEKGGVGGGVGGDHPQQQEEKEYFGGLNFPCGTVEYVWDSYMQEKRKNGPTASSNNSNEKQDATACGKLAGRIYFKLVEENEKNTNIITSSSTNGSGNATANASPTSPATSSLQMNYYIPATTSMTTTPNPPLSQSGGTIALSTATAVEAAGTELFMTIIAFRKALAEHVLGCYCGEDDVSDNKSCRVDGGEENGCFASNEWSLSPSEMQRAATALMGSTIPLLSVVEAAQRRGIFRFPLSPSWKLGIEKPHHHQCVGGQDKAGESSPSCCQLAALALLTAVLIMTSLPDQQQQQSEPSSPSSIITLLGGLLCHLTPTNGTTLNRKCDAHQSNTQMLPTSTQQQLSPLTNTRIISKMKSAAHVSTRVRKVLTARKVDEAHLGRKAYGGMVAALFAEECQAADENNNQEEGGGSSSGGGGSGDGKNVRENSEAAVRVVVGEKRPRCGEASGKEDESDEDTGTCNFPPTQRQHLRQHRMARDLYLSKQHLTRAQDATSKAGARVRSLLGELGDAVADMDIAVQLQASSEREYISAIRQNKIEHCALREVYEMMMIGSVKKQQH